MKVAGCLLMVLTVVIFAITFAFGAFAVKETAEKGEEVAGVDVKVSEQAILQNINASRKADEFIAYFAVLKVTVSSPEATPVTDHEGNSVRRPKFTIPYEVTVLDQGGTIVASAEGNLDTMTCAQDEVTVWVDKPSDSENRMTALKSVTFVAGEGEQAVSMTAVVNAKIENDAEGKAKIESARLVVLKKQLPIAGFAGLGLGMLASFCIGIPLGIVGLVLFIVGLVRKPQQPVMNVQYPR